MEEKRKAVAFTGHRPETIPYIDDTGSSQYFALEKMIWQEVHRYINAGYNTFYCGAARGADTSKDCNCRQFERIFAVVCAEKSA